MEVMFEMIDLRSIPVSRVSRQNIQVSIERDLLKRFNDYCYSRGLIRSYEIEQIINDFLAKQSKGCFCE